MAIEGRRSFGGIREIGIDEDRDRAAVRWICRIDGCASTRIDDVNLRMP